MLLYYNECQGSLYWREQDLTPQEIEKKTNKMRKCNQFWTTAKVMIYSRPEVAKQYNKATEWSAFGSVLLYSFEPSWKLNKHKNSLELYLIGRESHQSSKNQVYKAELIKENRTETQLSNLHSLFIINISLQIDIQINKKEIQEHWINSSHWIH